MDIAETSELLEPSTRNCEHSSKKEFEAYRSMVMVETSAFKRWIILNTASLWTFPCN